MGILAALISAFCASFKDVWSKKLSAKVDGSISAFASFAFALPLYLLVLGIAWLLGLETFKVAPGFFFWIFLRSLSDSVAEWCKMHAFQYGDLSVVSALLSLYPILLLFVSPFVTGDHLSMQELLAVTVTILGTVVILYKPRNAEAEISSKGVLFALGAAGCFSLNTCFDRLAVQTASPTLSGFTMALFAAVFLSPLLIRRVGVVAELRAHQTLFFQRGILEVSFMIIKLYALQTLSAPFVVAVQRVSVLISVVNGKMFFQEKHFVRRLIGALLTISGVCWIILQKL